MKSKTLISKQAERKENSELVKTIFSAKKHSAWLEVASILSYPKRKRISLNLDEINSKASEGDVIVVPGKILSLGDIDKKIKVVALSFSIPAKEKLLNSKIELSNILNEVKKNPEGKGIKILR